MTKTEPKSNKSPQWLQTLKPSLFARDWYDQTGFAQSCQKAIAKARVGKNQPLQTALLLAAKPVLA